MIKTIIFDFDGVILESNKAKGLAFVELLKIKIINFKNKFTNFLLITSVKDRDFKIKQIITKL